MAADLHRVEAISIERAQRASKRGNGIVTRFVEHAGHSVGDRVECARGAYRYDRRSTCLRFHGHDPEVFFARHDEGTAATVEINESRVVHGAKNLDPWARSVLDRAPHPTVTGHDEPDARLPRRADRGRWHLVRNEAAHPQEEVITRARARRESLKIDGWRHDRRLTAPITVNSCCDGS